MAIDYKKELESAAKSMILVHEPDTLIRMIVRMTVQKVKVIHAGILLHDEEQSTYILRVSRGLTGIKIPREFARMDYNNPLIRFFRERKDKQILGDGLIIYREAKDILKKESKPEIREILNGTLSQMEMLGAVVCIPSYYRDELLGILILGEKKSGRDFHRKELDFFVALASDVAMAIRNAKLFKQLQNELAKRQELFINTTISLSAAIEAKDLYTRGHTTRVTSFCLEMGKRLIEKEAASFDNKFLEHLHIAALLHDIGKIGVPENILNKKGLLNEAEWQKMKQHPTIGSNILQSIKELELAIKGVKHHHERYDGKGYPEGLDNGKIPLIAAIIAVADAFDAMTSDRPYRNAKSRNEAIKEIKRESGKQFHPLIVSVFLELCQEGKI
ncbi:MAG: HD domain-containing protein [Candidatus Omnitrophota bacterium]|jgi:HD-GYP domain-containing protein (c-di-GMP phosphodiesterase class II)